MPSLAVELPLHRPLPSRHAVHRHRCHRYHHRAIHRRHTFSYAWRITFIFDGALIQKCTKNMIDHFVLADGTRKNDIVRNDLLSEFEVRSALAVKFGFTVRTHPN